MENIFTGNTTQNLIDRVNKLGPSSQRRWGKMTVDQMLAHCNVAYDMTFTDKYPRPNAVARFFIKLVAKPTTCGNRPYKKNSRTAPAFIMEGAKDFEAEKKKLIDYLNQTYGLGAKYFDGKENMSFGVLTQQEWSNLFYKHLNHHLEQFGV